MECSCANFNQFTYLTGHLVDTPDTLFSFSITENQSNKKDSLFIHITNAGKNGEYFFHVAFDPISNWQTYSINQAIVNNNDNNSPEMSFSSGTFYFNGNIVPKNFKCYDMLGRIIYTALIQPNVNSLQIPNLQSGAYMIIFGNQIKKIAY